MVETHQGNPNLILKIVSTRNIVVFVFSLLSGVWSLAGSWCIRLGGKRFPGVKKKKKRSGKKYTNPCFFLLSRSLLFTSFVSVSQPLADDSLESPVPSRGESPPFIHIMGRLEGISLDSNDVLPHACLGDPCAFDILHDTQEVLHHAETRGRPPLPLSTNLVHFLPCCCFL